MAKLALLDLRLKIKPRETLRLPAGNKGNTLRGAFGVAFRRLVCIPQCKGASACPLGHRCPYKAVFEPSPGPEAQGLTNSQDVPRPFVFRPPHEPKASYLPGEDFEFGLVLVGASVDYLPYFVLSFRDIARHGFGPGRARCELADVRSVPPEVDTSGGRVVARKNGNEPGVAAIVYNAEDQLFHAPAHRTVSEWVAARLAQWEMNGSNGSAQRITARFLSPTSLKSEERVVRRPDFHHLFKRVRDRLSTISTFYGAGPIDADFKGLGERAEQVRTVDSSVTWVERSRVSSKTHQRHELSGFVGTCTFEGELAEFMPWLAAGELIGVGRHTAWGNGQFVIS